MPPKRAGSEFCIDHQKEVPWYDRVLDSLANLLEGDGHCVAVAIRPDTGQIVLGCSWTPNPQTAVPPSVRRLITMYFEFCRTLKPESGSPTQATLDQLVHNTLALSNPADIDIVDMHTKIVEPLLTSGTLEGQLQLLKVYVEQTHKGPIAIIRKFQLNQAVTESDISIARKYFASRDYLGDFNRAKSTLNLKKHGYMHDLNRVVAYAKSQEGQAAFRLAPYVVQARRVAPGMNRHAELEVVTHIVERTGQPPNYTGVGKLSCATCVECFQDLYGRNVATRGEANHPFFIRGTHGYRYEKPVDVPEPIKRLLKANFKERVDAYPIMPTRENRLAGLKANEALRTITSSSSDRSLDVQLRQTGPGRAPPPPAAGLAALAAVVAPQALVPAIVPQAPRSSLRAIMAEQQAAKESKAAATPQSEGPVAAKAPAIPAAHHRVAFAADAVEPRPSLSGIMAEEQAAKEAKAMTAAVRQATPSPATARGATATAPTIASTSMFREGLLAAARQSDTEEVKKLLAAPRIKKALVISSPGEAASRQTKQTDDALGRASSTAISRPLNVGIDDLPGVVLTRYNLQLHNVRADGHCFYHAIQHQLSRLMESEEFYRLALQWVLDHPDQYIGFILDNHETPEQALNRYFTAQLRPGEWADNVMINALADVLNLSIHILQFNIDGSIHYMQHINPENGIGHHPIYLANFNNMHFYSISNPEILEQVMHGVQPVARTSMLGQTLGRSSGGPQPSAAPHPTAPEFIALPLYAPVAGSPDIEPVPIIHVAPVRMAGPIPAPHAYLSPSPPPNLDGATGKVVHVQAAETPVLHIDTLITGFNAFMKLAHDCGSNLQTFGASLIDQANTLLNKLLDAARETTADAIMITSLLYVVDAINSGAEHVPLPPRKPDDSDGSGNSGYGTGDREPEAQGLEDVGLSGQNGTVFNSTYTFSS